MAQLVFLAWGKIWLNFWLSGSSSFNVVLAWQNKQQSMYLLHCLPKYSFVGEPWLDVPLSKAPWIYLFIFKSGISGLCRFPETYRFPNFCLFVGRGLEITSIKWTQYGSLSKRVKNVKWGIFICFLHHFLLKIWDITGNYDILIISFESFCMVQGRLKWQHTWHFSCKHDATDLLAVVN